MFHAVQAQIKAIKKKRGFPARAVRRRSEVKHFGASLALWLNNGGETMDEYIKKSDVVKILRDEIDASGTYDPLAAGYYMKILDKVEALPTADVEEARRGEWIVRRRHEHYPSGRAYDENVCPFCKRADHNGDGDYCGYCGAKMDGGKK